MNTTAPLPLGTRLEFLVPLVPTKEPPYPYEIGVVVGHYDNEDGAGYDLEVEFGDGTWRVAYGSWVIVGIVDANVCVHCTEIHPGVQCPSCDRDEPGVCSFCNQYARD
jgi:hypothetical protein